MIRPYHVYTFVTFVQLVPAIMYAFMGLWALVVTWILVTFIWAFITYVAWRYGPR